MWTYTYSNENILLTATKSGSTVSYAYDPQNLRKAKTVNGSTTNYINIPNSLASVSGQSIDPTTFGFNAGNQEIAEYDGSTNLLRRYVYGLGLDEPLVTIDAAGNHSYHFTDGLGSVVALANASGQLTEKHAYSAYGLASSTAGTPFQFAGRRVDPETGLYYNRARYYSPALGRFLQADPNGTDGGINLYAYAASDPVNGTDPLGLWTLQLGASFSAGYGVFSGTFSVGVAADLNGNIGGYASLAGPTGVGAYVKAGGSGSISSASTIYDLASNNASGLNSAGLPGSLSQASSATFGTGFGGSLDLGLGHGLDGKEYGSWGGTIGEVFGAGVGYGAQYTYITPINGGWPSPK